MKIEESFSCSKTGAAEKNEDALFVNRRFVAVIDGVTSKTAEGNRVSPGAFAARTLCRLLEAMPPLTEPEEILTWLNEGLMAETARSDYAGMEEPPAASIVFYDRQARRLISYGDCQYMLGGNVHKREKPLDAQCARKRAEILRGLLESGRATVAGLLERDVGREAIRQEILGSFLQYANREGQYGFPVLGVGRIVSAYIDVFSVAPGETVVLASDGYPVLFGTLAESEGGLERVIREDPLLIGQYPSTKGVVKGNISYDDRTYVRFIAP